MLAMHSCSAMNDSHQNPFKFRDRIVKCEPTSASDHPQERRNGGSEDTMIHFNIDLTMMSEE